MEFRRRVISAMFFTSVCLIFNGPSFAQIVNEEWVSKYSYNSLPRYSSDYAYVIGRDKLGNIYVAGDSSNALDMDYAVVKYDNDGNQLWAQRYNFGFDTDESVHALDVDEGGNVFVTGWGEEDSPSIFDYVTIKYDTDGNRQWVNRYDYDDGDDKAFDLEVDHLGNIYVTGASWDIMTNKDYATLKYGTDGKLLWAVRFNGLGNKQDTAYAMAIDKEANVYVAGTSWVDSVIGYNCVTLKYDQNGNNLWIAGNASQKDTCDYVYDLAVDSEGNVIATGWGYRDGTNRDFVTIKYDGKNGNKLWENFYNGSSNTDDMSYKLAIDKSDYIYITGSTYNTGSLMDCTTIKYDKNGSELWVSDYNGPGNGDDTPNGLVIDNESNVYITGTAIDLESYKDFVTIKYDTTGKQLWTAQYDGPGTGIYSYDIDRSNAIIIDEESNVYVAGSSGSNDTGYDYTTIKYSQEPTIEVKLEALKPLVPQGSDFSYEVTLVNNSVDPQDFVYWSKVKLPDGQWLDRYAVEPTNYHLEGGESTFFEVAHHVPGKAERGFYSYWSYVGPDENTIWDSDTFEFRVIKPLDIDGNKPQSELGEHD